jgi:aspartate 4-decarboxylase
MNKENVLDDQIRHYSNDEYLALNKRYESLITDSKDMKFIDRLVADSRTVALNHTAGLSTPQQVQMVLFSLLALIDTEDNYKRVLKRIIRRRHEALYRELGLPSPKDKYEVQYYTLLDFQTIANTLYGEEFGKYVRETVEPNTFLFNIAKETGIVLLPASGFGSSHAGGRVSLANLNEYDYAKIGRMLRQQLNSTYQKFLTIKCSMEN